MEAFTQHKGIVAPIDIANVDTDMIIPKQFLKSIKRSGFGPYLFDEMRYLDQGQPDMDCSGRPLNESFVLNQSRYSGCSVLLARRNFGCGSSREHAPWALQDFGIRALLAPSFADIFFNNCFKNGILPIELDEALIDRLFSEVESQEGYSLDIDLQSQKILTPSGESIDFDVDAFRKHCLLEGLDDIGLTLKQADKIKAFEDSHRVSSPWLFT